MPLNRHTETDIAEGNHIVVGATIDFSQFFGKSYDNVSGAHHVDARAHLSHGSAGARMHSDASNAHDTGANVTHSWDGAIDENHCE